MKRLIGMLTVAGVVAVSGFCTTAIAQDAGGAKHKDGVKHERPEAVDMTVTGTLSKETKTIKDKTFDVFKLTDASGAKIEIGGRRDGAGDIAAKLADFVGKDVTITGKGYKGDKGTRIVSITKVEAAVPPAPVAPQVPAK